MEDEITLGKSKKNYLLVKDNIGKSKPFTRDLPSEGFTYGNPNKKDAENAGVSYLFPFLTI